MFGGNPNARSQGPLQPHHIMQQSGAHNNNGIGGIAPGAAQSQAPAKGLNLNSMPQAPRFDNIRYTPTNPFASFHQPQYPLPTVPYELDWVHPDYQMPADPTGTQWLTKWMSPMKQRQIEHYDTLVGLQGQQLQATRDAAAAAAQRGKQMELLAQRDMRQGQLGTPRSGTHHFFGF